MHRFLPRKKEPNVLGEVQNQQTSRANIHRHQGRKELSTPSPSKSPAKLRQAAHRSHHDGYKTPGSPEPAKAPLAYHKQEKENKAPPSSSPEKYHCMIQSRATEVHEKNHVEMKPSMLFTADISLPLSFDKSNQTDFCSDPFLDGQKSSAFSDYVLNFASTSLSQSPARDTPNFTEKNDPMIFKEIELSRNRLQKTFNGQNDIYSDLPNREHQNSDKLARISQVSATSPQRSSKPELRGKELEQAFEHVLASENVPDQMRGKMRALSTAVKIEFIRNSKRRIGDWQMLEVDGPQTPEDDLQTPKAILTTHTRNQCSISEQVTKENKSPSKIGHSRGRTLSWKKGDDFFRRPRSFSRPRSLMSLKNLSSSSVNSLKSNASAEDSSQTNQVSTSGYVRYLQDASNPKHIEIGRLQRLRQLLRNETVSWVNRFIDKGGMSALLDVLRMVIRIEWREEHEELLLGELLKCLRALCSTQKALLVLEEEKTTLFPEFMNMLFDEERKGPSEYAVRQSLINLLFLTIQTGPSEDQAGVARQLLSFLCDPKLPADRQPVDFIQGMYQSRPYQNWCKELVSVTREVFWIFLHHLNVVPLDKGEDVVRPGTYSRRHFPKERPPIPTAPYVGGVEWDAANYIAAHLDLMNAIIVVLPDKQERNKLRAELKESGFERCLGGTLRLCKEKFYSCVHDGLKTWVSAAFEDGWEINLVRQGPMLDPEPAHMSSKKNRSSPQKLPPAPKLDLPLLNVATSGLHVGEEVWL